MSSIEWYGLLASRKKTNPELETVLRLKLSQLASDHRPDRKDGRTLERGLSALCNDMTATACEHFSQIYGIDPIVRLILRVYHGTTPRSIQEDKLTLLAMLDYHHLYDILVSVKAATWDPSEELYSFLRDQADPAGRYVEGKVIQEVLRAPEHPSARVREIYLQLIADGASHEVAKVSAEILEPALCATTAHG